MGAYEIEARSTSRFLLFDRISLEKASGNHQHAPGSAVSEDAAQFALKFSRAAPELRAEFAGEGPQALIADFKTDLGDGSTGCKHLTSTLHAQASQKIVRRFAKSGAE